jgi:sec-independent protein translocase protein TatB
MFEVGFSEILLIVVIALIVLGPRKLPKLAAEIGRWVGRARAMARQLQAQLDHEINLEEMSKARPTPTGASQSGSTHRRAGGAPGDCRERGQRTPQRG